jgi:hypothetical protein
MVGGNLNAAIDNSSAVFATLTTRDSIKDALATVDSADGEARLAAELDRSRREQAGV